MSGQRVPVVAALAQLPDGTPSAVVAATIANLALDLGVNIRTNSEGSLLTDEAVATLADLVAVLATTVQHIAERLSL